MQRILISIILICCIWVVGIKPFIGEVEYLKFKKTGDIVHLLNAIKYDTLSSKYNMSACEYYIKSNQFVMASEYAEIADNLHNGDLVQWVICYTKGVLSLQARNFTKAKYEIEQSLEYNPNFTHARTLLNEIKKYLEPKES